MTPRERVLAALAFRPVDKPALECSFCGIGLYEHGEKLRELFRTIEGDFGPVPDDPIPAPPPETIDAAGRYREYRTDAWGVKWAHNIFCGLGHPAEYPLADWANLARYQLPPVLQGEYDWACRSMTEDSERRYFKKAGWVGLFERMHSLRPFEDVLMDIYDDGPEINHLADLLVERHKRGLALLKPDVDAVQMADDFGTQTAMMLSPAVFRRFFKPRYAELVSVIKAQNRKALFHCCGAAFPILEDLRDIGIDAVWPQINAYGDLKEFAAYCRSIGLAVAIHPERSSLMVRGTPDDIRRKLFEYADIFHPEEGGSWFYLEIDSGFPYENIEALVNAVRALR